MARQNRRNTTTRRSNHPSSSLAGVWLTLGIFLGIGAMALAYIFFLSHPPQAKLAVQETKTSVSTPQKTEALTHKSHAKKQDKSKHPHPKNNAQRFEFYTLLPGMEVELPDSNNDKGVAQKVKNKPTVVANSPKEKPKALAHYIVQAGIFQELNQADALKAKLTLQGFSPAIQKVQTQEGNAWFRVTLGPFASESLALNQKKRLENQKIRGILILQRPNQ